MSKPAKTNLEKLTPKQRLFVEYYLASLRQTESAVNAGYARNSAHVTASKLLRNAKVLAAIKEGIELRVARVHVSQDFVLSGLVNVTHDPMASDSAKVAAFTQIGRHLGMFIDKTQMVGPDDLDKTFEYILDVIKQFVTDESTRKAISAALGVTPA